MEGLKDPSGVQVCVKGVSELKYPFEHLKMELWTRRMSQSKISNVMDWRVNKSSSSEEFFLIGIFMSKASKTED